MQQQHIDSFLVQKASQILYPNTRCNDVQKVAVDIMMMPDAHYNRFWNQMSYDFDIIPSTLINRFQNIVTDSLHMQSKIAQPDSKTASQIFNESASVSSQSLGNLKFQTCLVDVISVITGKMPQINQISVLFKKHQKQILSEMSKQLELSEESLIKLYEAQQTFQRLNSYKLSQADKQLLQELNRKRPALKPNQIVDIFVSERQSNYKIDRQNAVMFLVHSRNKLNNSM
ncbi:Hypothetical_protein [Hexamita inflata]|uniref:Hypothetical_protein n=2 Tax=Hexamita inflata TaxID=28002 RepID=A0AA86U4R6_9EUKA|nr:Hypothetical protein HINF_LOCUS27151 [Hexamita inflata]CAI9939507.1 Hypothetical protein HINF_LOCUS27152 [Hexamita inflata]